MCRDLKYILILFKLIWFIKLSNIHLWINPLKYINVLIIIIINRKDKATIIIFTRITNTAESIYILKCWKDCQPDKL